MVGSVLEPDPPDLGAGDLGSPLVAPCPLPSPAGPKEALPGYLQCEDKQEDGVFPWKDGEVTLAAF